MKLTKLMIIVTLMLTACLPPQNPKSTSADSQAASPSGPQTAPVQPASDPASADSHSDIRHTDVLDLFDCRFNLLTMHVFMFCHSANLCKDRMRTAFDGCAALPILE